MPAASSLYRRLMSVLAGSTQSDLRLQLEFVRAENLILRSMLPKRIRTTIQQRNRLVKLGRVLGPALTGILSIVKPGTFRRWVLKTSRMKKQPRRLRVPPRKRGRPSTPAQLRALILRFARENEWGQTRILGELRKLGFGSISRSTVRTILRMAGIPPRNSNGEGSWAHFLKIHARTLWACDFVSTRIVGWRGLVDAYQLVFIHVKSRRLYISPATVAPNEAWVARETSIFLDMVEQMGERIRILVRDRDTKFGSMFDAVLEDHEAVALVLPPRSPNLNAHVERVIQTFRRECLDHFIIIGRPHMNRLAAEFSLHYNRERPHSSLDHRTPSGPPSLRIPEGHGSRVIGHARLGGLLHHYERRAA